MAPKRKRDQYDSSDDEPLLGKQVLPIANLPDDFHGEPMDGAQYLFTVRLFVFSSFGRTVLTRI